MAFLAVLHPLFTLVNVTPHSSQAPNRKICRARHIAAPHRIARQTDTEPRAASRATIFASRRARAQPKKKLSSASAMQSMMSLASSHVTPANSANFSSVFVDGDVCDASPANGSFLRMPLFGNLACACFMHMGLTMIFALLLALQRSGVAS